MTQISKEVLNKLLGISGEKNKINAVLRLTKEPFNNGYCDVMAMPLKYFFSALKDARKYDVELSKTHKNKK